MTKWYEFNRRDHVRVIRRNDSFCKRCYLHHIGEITKLDYGTGGVSASREDPYIHVRFANGVHDGFWGTELEIVSQDTPLTAPVYDDDDALFVLHGRCT